MKISNREQAHAAGLGGPAPAPDPDLVSQAANEGPHKDPEIAQGRGNRVSYGGMGGGTGNGHGAIVREVARS